MHPIGNGLSKNIISIQYPGVVKNESKMLDTLGGIRAISSIYSEKNRRLELRLRPEDAFSKPAYGSRRTVAALILKIKVKKRKKEIVSYEVIGNVIEEFRFSNLCDFQFLPTTKNECIYDKVVPKGLDINWWKEESPYFLPPAAFSRIDSVQAFNFSKTTLPEENQPNVIGRLRRKRYGCTKCLSFDNPEVPVRPKEVPAGGISVMKIVTSEALDHLKKLFEERPIYSKNAIYCISRLPLIQLKCMLPCVAYYFTNGPWRSLWVRFGYDPRKDPSSRIFQTLDYRVRSHLSKDEVKQKRSYTGIAHPNKFCTPSGKSVSVISRYAAEINDKEENKEEFMSHIFRPGIIPPSRQCYYQYCDLHVPEIQGMIENLPPVEEQAVCHEVNGWLPPNMGDHCRNIMNKYISEEVKRRNELAAAGQSNAEARGSRYSGSDSDSQD